MLYTMNNVPYGTHGRLSVPSLGIDVAVNDSRGFDSQMIVDDDDSAAFIEWKDQNVIVDHRSQSFYYLPHATPGITTACLVTPASTNYYVCTYSGTGRITYGQNHACTFVDDLGNSVNSTNKDGICMYTCQGQLNGNELPVYVTYWRLSSVHPLHFLQRILSA